MKLYDLHKDDVLKLSVEQLGRNFSLSRNFDLWEFQSKDGHDEVLIHPALIVALQHIRDTINQPITVTSGYRSPAHNRNVGGATNSYHTLGMAADIRTTNQNHLDTITSIATDTPLGGIKKYNTFVHVDVGPRRSW